MLKIEWRLGARLRLAEILDYISDHNETAADALSDAIERAISFLPQHPHLYRPGRVAGTREIVVHPNYIVVYRVTSIIEIVTVLHARQQYP